MKYKVINLVNKERCVVEAKNINSALVKACRENKWRSSRRLIGPFEFKHYEVVPQFKTYTQKVYEPGKKYEL